MGQSFADLFLDLVCCEYTTDYELSQGNDTDICKYNFGYDVVQETLRAMKEYDASFKLPADFFEKEVVGAPSHMIGDCMLF